MYCFVTKLHMKCDKIPTNRLMPTVIGKSAFSSTAKFQALTFRARKKEEAFLKIELPFKAENIGIYSSIFVVFPLNLTSPIYYDYF